MRRDLVRLVITSVSVLALATACGGGDDVGAAKLRSIKTGMKLETLAPIVGEGTLRAAQPADSIRLFHGFKTQQYLLKGNSFRVLWYREAEGSLDDETLRTVESPILLQADTVIAVGWKDFTRLSDELGIPNPAQSRARLDSISKSQMPAKP